MRVRVLHVIGSLETGGAETALVRVCQSTHGLEVDHKVLVLGRVGPLLSDLQAIGITVLVPRIRPFDLARLFHLAADWSPQVVHGWMYHGSLAALALRTTLFTRASLAWNIRCGLDTPGQFRRSTRSLIQLLAALSRIPDMTVYNAISAREAHGTIGFARGAAEVVPNGFDLESFRPDPMARRELRSELALQEGMQLLGFIARFHQEKNPGLFLRALSRLPPQVHGLMVGSGMTLENLSLADQIRELGLRDRIHLLGERRDMPRIMAGLDVAVSASWNEGFSNALGEAQACGVPCVATAVGDSPVLIGGIGRLVAPGEGKPLAEAILELLSLSQEQRLVLGRRCRQRMLDCYSLPLVARRYSDLYRRLADRL